MSPEDEQDELWLDDEPRGPSVQVLAILAVATLVLAAAASAWLAVSFAQRGIDDFTLTPGKVSRAEQLLPSAEYTGGFLAQALLPLGLATVLCAVAVVAWHASVDRAARDWAGGLSIERWQALASWFTPLANLAIPFKALKELAWAHRARLAPIALWPWAALWAVSLTLSLFTANAGFAWSPFHEGNNAGSGDSDPTPDDLAKLDKYGVFIGSALALTAVLAIVIVLSLTAAVRARSGAQDDED